MEFIDCNTRVGRLAAPLSPLVEPTAEALLARMDACAVSSALCRHEAGCAVSAAEGNRRIAAVCAEHERLLPVFTLLPPVTGELEEQETLLETARRAGVQAFRIFPKIMLFSIAPYAMGELCEIAAALGKPVMMDIGEAAPDEIQRLASAFPKVDFLLTAVYYRNLRYLYPILQTCPNVYLETGFLKTFGSLEDICARFGAQRLVFGSGAPYYDMGGAAAHLLAADLREEDKALIASGNLERLCGWGRKQ